jgi:hypothetical protein
MGSRAGPTRETGGVQRWLLLAVWVTLPVTAGPAASDAITSWAGAPQVVAEVLLWAAWAVGLLAVVAPRPATLTAVRTIAPAFAVLAVATAIWADTDALAAAGAVAATVVAAVLVAGSGLAIAAANSIAYGDEQRFPLRTPPGLYAGPLPAARALVVAGVAGGPLLLADGDVVLGIVALVVGVPVALFLGRALHSLSRRWVVLVPAGLVVADPLTLADPVLFIREHIVSVRAVDGTARVPADVLDLRLGATAGSTLLTFDEEAELMRSTRARRGGQLVSVARILVATVRRDELLTTAARRQIRVEVTTP